jgi:hypothetical protein
LTPVTGTRSTTPRATNTQTSSRPCEVLPFSAKDFLDIANRGTIDMTLASLTHSGTIRCIRRDPGFPER